MVRTRRVRAMILSALTVELVHLGIEEPIAYAQQIKEFALTSYNLAKSTNRGHKPCANTAINSDH